MRRTFQTLESRDPFLTRRNFLSATAGGILLSGCQTKQAQAPESAPQGPADVTLHIGSVLADLAKDHTISTIGYNGSVPGPLIRFKEGVPAIVDLFNDTDTPEFVHWHGMIVPTDVDGAEEEHSLVVPRPRPSALPPHARALRLALRAFPCHVHGRLESRHL